jgi:hypothetical protein
LVSSLFVSALVALLEEYFDEWTARFVHSLLFFSLLSCSSKLTSFFFWLSAQKSAALHYRWNYEESAVFGARGIASDLMPLDEPNKDEAISTIAPMIQTWGKKAVRATATLTPTQQRESENELRRILTAFESHLQTQRFLLGDQPCAVGKNKKKKERKKKRVSLNCI